MRRENQPQGGGVLPPGYTQLEYIESTGTQYIKTATNFSTSNEFHIEYLIKTHADAGLFCAGKNSTRQMLYLTKFDRYDYCMGSGYKNLYVNSTYVATDVWHIVTMAYNNIIIDGTAMSLTGSANIISNLPMKLFATDFSDLQTSPSNFFIGRIRNFSVKSNDTYLMHLVPTLRTADSKPGLYDIINNTFYTNAGTGEFLYA